MSNPWKVGSWANQYGAGTHRTDSWNKKKLWKALAEDRKVTTINPQSDRVDENGRMYQTDSSAIKSFEYDPKSNTARIQFTSGDKKYDYNVTPEEAKDFLDADSKGRHVAIVWNHNPHYHKSS